MQGVTEVLAYGTAFRLSVSLILALLSGDVNLAVTVLGPRQFAPPVPRSPLARGCRQTRIFHERRIQQKGAAVDEGMVRASKGLRRRRARRRAPAVLIHLQVPLKIERVARGPALLPRQRRQKFPAENVAMSRRPWGAVGFAGGRAGSLNVVQGRTVKQQRSRCALVAKKRRYRSVNLQRMAPFSRRKIRNRGTTRSRHACSACKFPAIVAFSAGNF